MVDLNPNLIVTDLYMDPTKMAENGLNRSVSCTKSTTTSDANWNWKARKPYTMTKSRESWTDEEHDKFLEALQLFDRDWKKIEAFVGSKTVIQIRSHAQKYFLKVQKSGRGEHVPPPRPKRKAAHPYPQKASKTAKMVPQISQPFHSSGAVIDAGYICMRESRPTYEVGISGSAMAPEDCSSGSIKSSQRGSPTSETNDSRMVKFLGPERVLPDFAKVYHFIGSIFDPNANGHLQKLKSMDPITVETILLLMKNLTVNLLSPEFENHKKMLCSYYDKDSTKPCGFHGTPKQENVTPLV